MKLESDQAKAELQRRLRRIEGQVRGVQNMLDEDRECHEIVQQLNAASAAVRTTTSLLLRTYAKECLLRAETLDRYQAQTVIDELMDVMARVR